MFRAFAIVIVIFGELRCFDALRQTPVFPIKPISQLRKWA